MNGTAQQRAALSKQRGQDAKNISDPTERRKFIEQQGKNEAGDLNKEGTGYKSDSGFKKTKDNSNAFETGLALRGGMADGGKVKADGAYQLSKGEEVLKGDEVRHRSSHKSYGEVNEKRHGHKLTYAERKSIPKSEFGLPGKKSESNKAGKGAYPMPDDSHARNAKARASEEEHKGKLSKSSEEKIDAKADRILGKGKK